jgi:hypothetical protein
MDRKKSKFLNLGQLSIVTHNYFSRQGTDHIHYPELYDFFQITIPEYKGGRRRRDLAQKIWQQLRAISCPNFLSSVDSKHILQIEFISL